jgi:site-specific DNA-cytosine methylase
MRVLELFSGTGSVGKVCEELGYEVISLDLKNADINTNILEWDYTIFPVGYFDIIWASPPCNTFSNIRKCWYGRKLKCHHQVFSKELELKDRLEIGLPILRKTEEIIDYFKPSLWFIENPKTGSMKDYIDKPFYDVDYCKYSDWGYQKPTRIWTNKKDFIPLTCNGKCESIKDGKHKANIGSKKVVQDGDKLIIINTKELREKYKNYPNIRPQVKGGGNNRTERYRIPENLIKSLFYNSSPILG